MWAALTCTVAVMAVAGWYTVQYAGRAATAPPIAPPAATAAPRSAAVISSSSRPANGVIATSTPVPEPVVEVPAAPAGGDWFATIGSLPALAVRSVAGAPTPRPNTAQRPTDPPSSTGAGPTPPPPVVVDLAAARATARALESTPVDNSGYLFGFGPPPGASSRVILPTVVPTGGAEATPTPPIAGSPTAQPATPTRFATLTPTPYRREAGVTGRPLDGGAAFAPTPRPTRAPRPPWRRRTGAFPTPAVRTTPGARPTPGGSTYTPPPIRNGQDKWGIGIYKDSNRVADMVKETRPGVVLLMDPSEGWARRVREQLPNAFIVGRRYKPETQQPLDRPEQRGVEFADWVAESAVPLKGVVDAWMSYNEVLGSEPSEDYANYNRFQVAFAKRLQDGYGIAAVASNDGSGALAPEDYPTHFADAIRASAFFGVHAYSAPGTSSMQKDAEWNALRYRKIHDALERAGIRNVRFVITESGLGDGFRQGIASDESMAGDFAWFTQELRQDPYMIGQAAFGLFDSTGAWPRFDLTDSAVIRLMPQLVAKPK